MLKRTTPGTMMPITWLTLRQFRAGKAVWVAAGFAAIPVLMALIYVLQAEAPAARTFLSETYLNLVAPTVVPLATLVLATSALGNEISDHTLAYLILKPVSRLRIVTEKYVGTVVVAGAVFLAGLTAGWAVAMTAGSGADGTVLRAMLAATAGGIVAYGALFILVSLVIPRALVAGILYVLLWESVLARFLPGIKLVSVRHFSQSIFVRTLGDATIELEGAVHLLPAAAVLAAAALASLALASLWLRRMNLD